LKLSVKSQYRHCNVTAAAAAVTTKNANHVVILTVHHHHHQQQHQNRKRRQDRVQAATTANMFCIIHEFNGIMFCCRFQFIDLKTGYSKAVCWLAGLLSDMLFMALGWLNLVCFSS